MCACHLRAGDGNYARISNNMMHVNLRSMPQEVAASMVRCEGFLGCGTSDITPFGELLGYPRSYMYLTYWDRASIRIHKLGCSGNNGHCFAGEGVCQRVVPMPNLYCMHAMLRQESAHSAKVTKSKVLFIQRCPEMSTVFLHVTRPCNPKTPTVSPSSTTTGPTWEPSRPCCPT